jgi:hypothetical protein
MDEQHAIPKRTAWTRAEGPLEGVKLAVSTITQTRVNPVKTAA